MVPCGQTGSGKSDPRWRRFHLGAEFNANATHIPGPIACAIIASGSSNFREHFARTKDPIEKLDVTLLQKYVLAPLFGIDDPRTSKRINFVGGIRGTAELEKLVNSGDYACAFSMFPTSIEDLMTIADAGGIMPPKSTWFEPKLRDAMFCHMI